MEIRYESFSQDFNYELISPLRNRPLGRKNSGYQALGKYKHTES